MTTFHELKKQMSDVFSAIDLVFAEFIYSRRISGTDSKNDQILLYLAAAMASASVRKGHACCALKAVAGKNWSSPEESDSEGMPIPEYPAFESVLTGEGMSPVVSSPASPRSIPLVFDPVSGRLYLNRYFLYERKLAKKISSMLEPFALDEEKPTGYLNRLSRYFHDQEEIDYQRLAVFTSSHARFSVITGGPGTGKTTVVAALLALELERNPELSVQLCAPTGKAQARMTDSIRNTLPHIRTTPEIRSRLSTLPCGTLHSTLRCSADGVHFRYDAKNPLPADLVVVDEASMISLSLMFHLFDALKPDARIILLGDRDQLASVDAGSVLSDLCECAEVNTLPPLPAELFRRETSWRVPVCSSADSMPLSGFVTELKKNHRSASAPNLLHFAGMVNHPETSGGIASVATAISLADFPDFQTCPLPSPRHLEQVLEKAVTDPVLVLKSDPRRRYPFSYLKHLALRGGHEDLLLDDAFEILNGFKILCSLRNGIYGVVHLNELLAEMMNFHHPFDPGMPLMIRTNNPTLRLFNGDIGLVWKSAAGSSVRVFFQDREPETGGVCYRSFHPSELPSFEPVFAMTIHKSQGSGFRNVLTFFPDRPNPVLTRELLYTAITRAEKRHLLYANLPEILHTLEHRTIRHSGLADQLLHRP